MREEGEGEGEGGPVRKKVAKVTWEWEEDGGKWSQFSADHSRLLSEALANGESVVTFQVAKTVKMKICFDMMTQSNVKTGWQRNVRCTPLRPGSSDSQTAWEWENDCGKWAWFPPAHQRLLEACESCQVGSVTVETTPGKRSRVDLGSMNHEAADGKEFGVRRSFLAGQLKLLPTSHHIPFPLYAHFLLCSLSLPPLPPPFLFLSQFGNGRMRMDSG